MAYTSNDALKTGYKIYASDINELKAEIKGELDRRHEHDFTNFNNNLLASKNSNITPNIWNNLINPLNTINEDITNYSSVNQHDYIRALVKLSLARLAFKEYKYRKEDGDTGSGCKNGCLGMCWGCSNCYGTCSGGCQNDCMNNCADCSGDCYNSCFNVCRGCGGQCSWNCGLDDSAT